MPNSFPFFYTALPAMFSRKAIRGCRLSNRLTFKTLQPSKSRSGHALGVCP
jgi:hypothetical protein